MKWLSDGLGSGQHRRLRMIAAFAKEGPLIRLEKAINVFRAKQSGTVEVVLGIDQQGTSIQALTRALAEFDAVYVWHHPSPFTTFHPKIYILEGDRIGQIYLGSSNLTVGGLETNCEAGAIISHCLPDESAEWMTATECWRELLQHPNTTRLDLKLLSQLQADDVLLDELSLIRTPAIAAERGSPQRPSATAFPYTTIIPPSALPHGGSVHAGRRRAKADSAASGKRTQFSAASAGVPNALAIQIVPHHNGEVFLSKRAIDQYPIFFGFPFTGQTVPKRSGNPPYPQRTPDPITDWDVYDSRNRVTHTLRAFRLNTVFYERKGEIRVTIPPEMARVIPAKSILVMSRPSVPSSTDYRCEVFPPGSKEYAALLLRCKETMPSGGGGSPRRFGWL